MCTFLLIRHGSHDYLTKGIAGWLPGVRINARGREEAGRLADSLAGAGIQALYSSPLDRTMETAECISRRLSLPIHVEEAFGEVRFGEWTGWTLEELERDPRWLEFNRFRSGVRAPGGESLLEVQARVIDGMERIRRRHTGSVVAIVSHGDVIKAALMYWLGMPLDFLERFEIGPASVSVVRVEEWGVRVLRINAAAPDEGGGAAWL